MEQGVTKWKGKNLDQLDMTMECDGEGNRGEDYVDDCNVEGGGDLGNRSPSPMSDARSETSRQAPVTSRQAPVPWEKRQDPASARRRVIRRVWTDAEKAAVRRQLAAYLDHFEIPGKAACERAIEAESALSGRSWKKAKYYVYYNAVRAATTNLHFHHLMYNIGVAGILRNPSFCKMPRQFAKCLILQAVCKMPRHFAKRLIFQTVYKMPRHFAK